MKNNNKLKHVTAITGGLVLAGCGGSTSSSDVISTSPFPRTLSMVANETAPLLI
jgi:outer membrane murein-binding lipoprotein Lpp